jgi:hypothetical protein
VHLARPSSVSPRPLDLDEVIAETISETCPGPASVDLSLAGDLPPVHLDAGQGRTLIESLLLVSRQLSEDQPVTLRTGACPDGGAMLEMHVASHPFPSASQGSELAMACARHIAEAHGGTLESGAGEGGIHVRVMLP